MFVIGLVLLVGIVFLARWLNDYLRRKFVPNFAKKAVFVTGTDSGFGREIALDLSTKGLTVFAGCYTDRGAESLKSAARSRSRDIRIVKVDVSDDDSVRRAKETVERALPKGQGLWGIVNNAGIPGSYMEEWSTIADYKQVMDVNFFGQVRVVMAFLPLIKMARGRIVNMSSILGRLTLLCPYCTSKAAVHAYSDGIRRQFAADGIKVSLIEPGVHPTNMSSPETTKFNIMAQWKALSEKQRKEFGGDEYITKVCDQLVSSLDKMPLTANNRVSDVIECVRHALGSVWPKKRYVTGSDARFLYRPMALLLPDWAIDALLTRIF